MSFSLLQYPASLYKGNRQQPPPPTVATSDPSTDTASKDSYIRPLVQLLRKPSRAFTQLLGEFQAPASADQAQAQLRQDRQKLLYLKLQNADNFEEWRNAAYELDELEGNNAWKLERESPDYDYVQLESCLHQLDQARASGDPRRMLFLVRTALTRHPGGIDNLKLYKHTHLGTKELIERYIRSALDTLSALCDASRRPSVGLAGEPPLDPRALLEQVLAARQAFGRSALLLSGGGTFGMNHIGVVKSLWEAKLLPRIVSGASAGSIVCAVLCVRTDEEMPAVMEHFCYGDLDVFTKEGDVGLLPKLSRFLKQGNLFDIANLTRVMHGLVGDMTFQEAYNRTRRILNITVSSAGVYELPRLLNYITAPNVIIWSAVAASCSVPLIFSPASLSAKDPRTGEIGPWNPSPQRWIDGSVDNDLPMTRLAEMFNVNHFIVSQVNPHVVPFLAKEEDEIATQANSQSAAVRLGTRMLGQTALLAKDEALHRMQLMAELGVLPNAFTKMRSMLSQKYSGDITILPEFSWSQMPKILTNPTPDFMLGAALTGERATWPKLSRIQNHCAVELALDDTVQQLRARIAFSPSQVDLRLHVSSRPHSRAGSDGGDRRRRKHSRKHKHQQSHESTNDQVHSQRRPMMTSKSFTGVASLRGRGSFRSSSDRPFANPLTKANTTSLEQVDASSTSPPDSALSDSDSTANGYDSSASDDEDGDTENQHLYLHASMPNTPLAQRGWPSFSISPASPTSSMATKSASLTSGAKVATKKKHRPPTPVQPSSPLGGAFTPVHLAMTAAPESTPRDLTSPSTSASPAAISSPEARYKQLFHSKSTSSSQPSSRIAFASPTSASSTSSSPVSRSRRGSQPSDMSTTITMTPATSSPRPTSSARSSSDLATIRDMATPGALNGTAAQPHNEGHSRTKTLKRSLSSGIRLLRPPGN